MKILHLIYDDIRNPWCGGGGAVRAYEINRRLARKHEITVVTGNYPGARNEVIEGIKYQRIGSNKSYLRSRITYTSESRRAIKRLPHDILVEDFSANSPCFSSWVTSKPVVAQILNYFGINSLKKRKIMGLVPVFFEYCGIRMFRNFIVETAQMKSQIGKMFAHHSVNIKIIPNGVNNELFELSCLEKEYILFVGRMEIYQKGIDILLDSFKIIADKYNNIRLLFIGDTKHKDMSKIKTRIEKLNIEDKIQFLGRIMNSEIRNELLSQCLFVCLPSRYDTMPLVSMEAAACGKPIIATRIPGLSDVVQDGKTGILVEPDSKQSLANAMEYLLENDKIRHQMGRNAREWARKFSWDSIARQQEIFYYQVCEKRK